MAAECQEDRGGVRLGVALLAGADCHPFGFAQGRLDPPRNDRSALCREFDGSQPGQKLLARLSSFDGAQDDL